MAHPQAHQAATRLPPGYHQATTWRHMHKCAHALHTRALTLAHKKEAHVLHAGVLILARKKVARQVGQHSAGRYVTESEHALLLSVTHTYLNMHSCIHIYIHTYTRTYTRIHTPAATAAVAASSEPLTRMVFLEKPNLRLGKSAALASSIFCLKSCI